MQVHILNESRGSTLEVVVSRMKTRGSAVRFVAVSATVPNIDDVAHWIENRSSNGAAATFQVFFWRPCCCYLCLDCLDSLANHIGPVNFHVSYTDFQEARTRMISYLHNL
jgi:Lhr-like helicase